MSKRANGLQSITAPVGHGPLGGCTEGAAVTEFSAAAMPAASRGTVTRARDRAVSSLKFIHIKLIFK